MKNWRQIINWILDVIESHNSIHSISLADITEFQLFDDTNTHAYISIEAPIYQAPYDLLEINLSVLILTNSARERTQLIQSLGETIAISQEILFYLNKFYQVEDTEFTPHIQNDDKLTIGNSFNIRFNVQMNNDACINPFTGLEEFEETYNI